MYKNRIKPIKQYIVKTIKQNNQSVTQPSILEQSSLEKECLNEPLKRTQRSSQAGLSREAIPELGSSKGEGPPLLPWLPTSVSFCQRRPSPSDLHGHGEIRTGRNHDLKIITWGLPPPSQTEVL